MNIKTTVFCLHRGFYIQKEMPDLLLEIGLGAGGRGRTDTVSLPLDFESSTSANSITPANIQLQRQILYHTTDIKVNTFMKFFYACIKVSASKLQSFKTPS